MSPHLVPALLLFGSRLVALHAEGRTEVSKLKMVLPSINMHQVNGEHDLLRDCPDEDKYEELPPKKLGACILLEAYWKQKLKLRDGPYERQVIYPFRGCLHDP